jgi:putative GTP pyrophosphokinase
VVDMNETTDAFDFQSHADRAVTDYLQVHRFFLDLADSVRRVVEEALRRRGINVHSVQARAKDPQSFGKKAARPDERDPSRPKYADPLREITDLAAVRIITYFPGTLPEIEAVLKAEFDIIERADKGQILLEEERFGYQSIHFLVRIKGNRAQLPEYERCRDSIVEIQLRTILQHAWAEIEHDIQYKGASVIPIEIHRRFMALAGMLEIADREFQAIQNADAELRASARANVVQGRFENIEITPDALKTYLDRRLGPDGRISQWSYTWTARLLHRFGFRTLAQVDEAIKGYDDDRLSRIAEGGRPGQTSRFETMLLAALGEKFIERHSFAEHEWFRPQRQEVLGKLQAHGVPVGTYDPLAASNSAAPPNKALEPTAPSEG